MSEESPTADLVERWRQSGDSCVRGGTDAAMSFYARAAARDGSDSGLEGVQLAARAGCRAGMPLPSCGQNS